MSVNRWSIPAVVAALTAVTLVAFALTRPPRLCAQLSELIERSADGFADDRGEVISESAGEWASSYSMSSNAMHNSDSCSMFLDIERSAHLCSWEFSNAGGFGTGAYDATVAEVRACLNGATESEDPSVNHPDFWAATNFAIPHGEVSVALKNKNALGLVFVSIGVDRFVER